MHRHTRRQAHAHTDRRRKRRTRARWPSERVWARMKTELSYFSEWPRLVVVVGVPVVVACLFCTIALSWLSLSLSGLSLSTFATVSQNRCIGFQGNCDFLTQHSISKTCRGRNFSWAPKSVQWNHLFHFRLQNRNHTYEVIKNHRRFNTFK